MNANSKENANQSKLKGKLQQTFETLVMLNDFETLKCSTSADPQISIFEAFSISRHVLSS